MTIFAGAFNRSGRPVRNSLREALRQVITRNPNDTVVGFDDKCAFFLKVDIGAFGESGFHVDSTGFSLMAGEPLLAHDDETSLGRNADLQLLHQEWSQNRWERPATARGVFCAMHYQSRDCKLTLVTDKLSIRPLYYYVDSEYVLFGTALRILENLCELPKLMDLRAVTELLAVSVPLGDRTPYANIARLRPAEVLQVTQMGIKRWQYWRWDSIEERDSQPPDLLRGTHQKFVQAVARRLRTDRRTIAYLSGGLDTRCIVATLRDHDAEVHTFTFAHPETQDQVFGAQFARCAGTRHREILVDFTQPADWSMLMANAWQAERHSAVPSPERPRLVWAGFGGGEALGGVGIESESLIELIRNSSLEVAVDAAIAHDGWRFPRRLLTREFADVLACLLRLAIHDEWQNLRFADPARRYYVFRLIHLELLHFFEHFENIDLHRIEMQLPFLDSDFLAFVMTIPIQWCLRHNFYTDLLAQFPPTVVSVPWQAYPGHQPCPIRSSKTVVSQWELRPGDIRASQRATLQEVRALLRVKPFPDGILRKDALRAACWLHGLGVRDCQYHLNAAKTFLRYWELCNGK